MASSLHSRLLCTQGLELPLLKSIRDKEKLTFPQPALSHCSKRAQIKMYKDDFFSPFPSLLPSFNHYEKKLTVRADGEDAHSGSSSKRLAILKIKTCHRRAALDMGPLPNARGQRKTSVLQLRAGNCDTVGKKMDLELKDLGSVPSNALCNPSTSLSLNHLICERGQ